MGNTYPTPPGAGHEIICKFTSILNFKKTIAELPITSLQFSKALNTAGPWNGILTVEDENVRKTPWLNATAVNRSVLWVDIDGTLLYGGIVQGRRYQKATGIATLMGADLSTYFSQRLQARDYTAYTDPESHAWAVDGAPVARIAYYMLTQALEKTYSIPIKVVTSGPTPSNTFWMTFSAPLTQHQALGSLLSQMTSLGFEVGIDYAQDLAYGANGAPEATITLSYPRRGTGPPIVIDLTDAADLQYDEDGTQQADRVIEQAGATEDRSSLGIWLPAGAAGYPLLETCVSHPSLAPTAEGTSDKILESYVGGELATRAYPLTAPVLVLPMFGTPSIFELDVGQDITLRVPKAAGEQPKTNPRFPNGLETTFRIVRIDCEVPDAGVPLMSLTLNLPPTVVPVEPPETTLKAGGGGSPAEPKESVKEEAEKAAEEVAAEEEKAAEVKLEKERLETIKKAKEERVKKAKELKEEITKGREAYEKITKGEAGAPKFSSITGGEISVGGLFKNETGFGIIVMLKAVGHEKGKVQIKIEIEGSEVLEFELFINNFMAQSFTFPVPAGASFRVITATTETAKWFEPFAFTYVKVE
jgi:hypothetical protein